MSAYCIEICNTFYFVDSRATVWRLIWGRKGVPREAGRMPKGRPTIHKESESEWFNANFMRRVVVASVSVLHRLLHMYMIFFYRRVNGNDHDPQRLSLFVTQRALATFQYILQQSLQIVLNCIWMSLFMQKKSLHLLVIEELNKFGFYYSIFKCLHCFLRRIFKYKKIQRYIDRPYIDVIISSEIWEMFLAGNYSSSGFSRRR